MKVITNEPIVILSFSEKVDCIVLTQLLSPIKGIMTRNGLEWNNNLEDDYHQQEGKLAIHQLQNMY